MAPSGVKATSTYIPIVNLANGLAARVRSGLGEGTLWLHDYPVDSSIWEQAWEMLPESHHIGIDLPGCGVSLPPRISEELPAIAERIVSVAIEQDVRHVVALGFGSIIALQMAIQNPSLFSTLVLASPSIGGGPFNPEVLALYEELQAVYQIDGFGPYLREFLMLPPSVLFRGLDGQPDLWDRLWRIVGRHGWWELLDGWLLRFMNHPQSADQLRHVKARALVLVGEHDLAATKECAETIAGAIPQGRCLELKGTGNLSVIEDPANACKAIYEHTCGRTQGRGERSGNT